MNHKIWKHLIQILYFRNDLIDTIKPFFQKLENNNETYNINEEKHIQFLQSLSEHELSLLQKYEIISPSNAPKGKVEEKNEKIYEEIIKKDNLEELQKLIREKGINAINQITTSFNEIETMTIPIIIFSIIHKAIKCFKYLLINGIEDPKKTMTTSRRFLDYSEHPYEWDCMTVAIYYGEVEIMKILEENGIEKWNNPVSIEAAILSYRNGIAKEIINQMKGKIENENQILMTGLLASVKSNNIKGFELLINNGGDLNLIMNQTPTVEMKRTLLHWVVYFQSKEILEILITKRADINVKDIIYQIIG